MTETITIISFIAQLLVLIGTVISFYFKLKTTINILQLKIVHLEEIIEIKIKHEIEKNRLQYSCK